MRPSVNFPASRLPISVAVATNLRAYWVGQASGTVEAGGIHPPISGQRPGAPTGFTQTHMAGHYWRTDPIFHGDAELTVHARLLDFLITACHSVDEVRAMSWERITAERATA